MPDVVTITTELRREADKAVSMFNNHVPIDVVSSQSVADIREAWSPLHMFTAAVESCFYLTLEYLAEKMKIRMVSFSSSAEAVFGETDGKHVELRSFAIRPTFHLENEKDRPRLELLVRKAEEYCYVTRSLKVPINIEL